MLAKGDGLGPLHMGIARHDGIRIGLRLVAEHLDQLGDGGLQLAAIRPESEPQVQGHLVVAAPGGMQALTRVPNAAGQFRFDKGMDILTACIHLQPAAFQVLCDGLQPLGDGCAVRLGQDTLPGQHGPMGQGTLDILGRHTAIHPDGGVEIIRRLIQLPVKLTCP